MQMTTRALAYGLVFGFLVAVAPACGTVKPPAKCNSTTCADGCCGTDGECYTGVSPQACGTGAATCQECTSGESCVQGQCRLGTDGGGGGAGGSGGSGGAGGGTGNCNATNCAGGCCKSDGTCQTVTSAQACGKMGAACAACSFGQTCAAGTCTSNTCGSCRDGAGNCVDGGNTDNVCGTGGNISRRCDTANGQMCQNGNCVGGSCNANNCSDGCCAAGTCVRDGGVAQCGGGGVACQTCNGTAQCVNNACTGGGSDGGFNLDGGFGTCDALSCPTGCCVQGVGICLPGDDPFIGCGTGGADCVSCFAQFLFTCDATSRTWK